jgi:ribonuclease HI
VKSFKSNRIAEQRRKREDGRNKINRAATVLCDGLCKPINPGGLGCWAFVVLTHEGIEVAHASGCIGRGKDMSNNLAEYHAVIEALEWIKEIEPTAEIEVRTDSQLVVSQINGTLACRAAHLCQLRDKAALLLSETRAKLTWIPREQNKHADAHSKVAYYRIESERRMKQ